MACFASEWENAMTLEAYIAFCLAAIVIVILSNPKVLLVFGALIPQFISPDGDYLKQLILLGLSFMVIATVFDSLYAFAAGNAGSWLSNSRVRAVEVSSGLCLIGGGIWLALRGR